MKKLIKDFKILTLLFTVNTFYCCASNTIKTDDIYKNQSYSIHTYCDETGTYNVDELLKWAADHREKFVLIPTEKFLKYISSDTWSDESEVLTSNLNSLLKDKTEQKRMQSVSLSDPIIIDNFYKVIDGVHRVMKAVVEGKDVIKAIFIEKEDLEKYRLDENACIGKKSAQPNLPIPDIFFILPKHHLPEKDNKRSDIIETYFTEHLPNAYRFRNQWMIQLERPGEHYGCYSHDPNINAGLSWWRSGTRICDIPVEYRVNENALLAIEDQWVPYSWSIYFQQLGYIPQELILLHIDDHQDMMSPRVGYRGDGRFVDYITKNSFSLFEPEKVRQAILSGAIGKGSIITPLIWSVKKIHIRHLSDRPYLHQSYRIDTVETVDTVISKLNNRISSQTHPVSLSHLTDSSNYFVSNNVQEWLKNLPDFIPVLLHFDMDYFNNRFDGNSSWQEENTRSHDPSLEKQQAKIKEIIFNLQKREIFSRIGNISIGISASFFPGEFWEPMINTLFKELSNYGINLINLNNN